jgi:hypothetical protein
MIQLRRKLLTHASVEGASGLIDMLMINEKIIGKKC